MSEKEFNAQVAEVVEMVNMAHHNRPREWGIIVPGDQVKQLLELEANRSRLELEVENSKRTLANVKNQTREIIEGQNRVKRLPQIMDTAAKLMIPLAFLLGVKAGMMDFWFAWAIGAPCILWAVCSWRIK